jgi:integrase
MAGKPKDARVQKWRGSYYLFYWDHKTGRQRRLSCESLKAHNAEQRKELVRQYKNKEATEAAEVLVTGHRLDGDALLAKDIEAYLKDCKRRVELREANPDVRAGLSKKSLISMEGTLTHLQDWIEMNNLSRLKSKDLTAKILTKYVDHVVSQTTRLGNKRKKRSAATINLYLRNLKACLKWIQRQTPRRFNDMEALLLPLKPVAGKSRQAMAFSPTEMQAFLTTALEREDESRTILVKPAKGKRHRAEYQQPAAARSATPVSRIYLMLALTGCRLEEALQLRWQDVDVDRGRLIIHAPKTGRTRHILLKAASEGEVAPRLAKLLKLWRDEDPRRKFVLPHGDLKEPVFPKSAWQVVNKQAGVQRIGPQKLRQNFTSYAASLGIPPAVAAMWQGHGVQVAEKHYRAQVLDRNKDAADFEEAMGLDTLIDQMLAEGGTVEA